MRVSDSIGGEGGGSSYLPTISGDGSRVAYWSTAWDLVPDDPNAVGDVYLWDATTETTSRLTQNPFSESSAPVISDDGRVVAYTSAGSSVFVWDSSTGTASRIGSGRARGISADGRRVLFTSDVSNVYVWDASTGTTTRVTDRGYPGNPSMSNDGRHVVYSAEASDLPTDTNGVHDVLVWDATTGDTIRITDGDGASTYPDVSADGRYVAFLSTASNLVPGQVSAPGVFVWDAETDVTRRATGIGVPAISADGRYVALSSSDADLVPGDANGVEDVFLWNATTGATSRLTDGDGASYTPSISADGSAVTFSSEAANLTDDDPDGVQDVFLWRRST